jgi:hypothetical protein
MLFSDLLPDPAEIQVNSKRAKNTDGIDDKIMNNTTINLCSIEISLLLKIMKKHNRAIVKKIAVAAYLDWLVPKNMLFKASINFTIIRNLLYSIYIIRNKIKK